MSGISDTFVDSIIYWPPGQVESTGASVYERGEVVNKVRVDTFVAKEIRDLLVDKKPTMTAWSLQPFEVGGWLCDVAVFDAAPLEHLSCPQLIAGARQILHTDNAKSYDGREVYWRAVA